MKYSIKVNEVRAKEGSNVKGFATVVFGSITKLMGFRIPHIINSAHINEF